jgi:hypothetical protein
LPCSEWFYLENGLLIYYYYNYLQIEVLRELKAELFPHYMERENSFNSTSILGLIYDTVNSYQAEDLSMKGEDSLY